MSEIRINPEDKNLYRCSKTIFKMLRNRYIKKLYKITHISHIFTYFA